MLGIWFQLKLTLSDLSLRIARVHLLLPSYLPCSKRRGTGGSRIDARSHLEVWVSGCQTSLPLPCLLSPHREKIVFMLTSPQINLPNEGQSPFLSTPPQPLLLCVCVSLWINNSELKRNCSCTNGKSLNSLPGLVSCRQPQWSTSFALKVTFF